MLFLLKKKDGNIDDETHITGLIAVKQCMLRSQTWTSTLESLFKVYEASPVPEKAQVRRLFLIFLFHLLL